MVRSQGLEPDGAQDNGVTATIQRECLLSTQSGHSALEPTSPRNPPTITVLRYVADAWRPQRPAIDVVLACVGYAEHPAISVAADWLDLERA
jgi:hypothetical protein